MKKSNQNLGNKDSLVRETLLIKTFRNRLNTAQASIDLNTIKIPHKERHVRRVGDQKPKAPSQTTDHKDRPHER